VAKKINIEIPVTPPAVIFKGIRKAVTPNAYIAKPMIMNVYICITEKIFLLIGYN
jgi:hypothetical protein